MARKNTVLAKTDMSEFEKSKNYAMVYAETLKITTASEYQTAISECAMVKRLKKKIVDFFEPMRVRAKAAYDEVLKQRSDLTNPLDMAEEIIKAKLTWWQRQEEIRIEEEARKAREAAEKKHEQDLQEMREAGLLDDEEAEEVASEPIDMAMMPVTPEPVKVQGHSVSRKWRVVVDHPHLVPREHCSPDLAKLNATANAHDGQIEIPGCRVEEVITQRIAT